MGEWDYFRAIQVRSDLFGLKDPEERVLVPSAIADITLHHGLENVFDAITLDNIGIRDAVISVTGWKAVPSTRSLLQSLYADYGILRVVGDGQYCFVHPRIAQWCAAYFAWRAGRVETLPSHLDDARWAQVIILGAQLARPHLRPFVSALEARVDLDSTLHVRTLTQVYRAIQRYASAESQHLVAKTINAIEAEIRALQRDKAVIHVEGGELVLRDASEGRVAHLQSLIELAYELPLCLDLIPKRAQDPILKAWAPAGSMSLRLGK
jgi:hypothetical protein